MQWYAEDHLSSRGANASPAMRVQATQLASRAQCWAHWAALWVWGMTVSESALKLTKPLEYCSVLTPACDTPKSNYHLLIPKTILSLPYGPFDERP